MEYEQMIMEEVKRYLSDDTYDYALLIDGDWGSGKTYFVKEILNRELNAVEHNGGSNRVRYYSACGVETLSEFKETMIYDLLERKVGQVTEGVSRDAAGKESALQITAEEKDEARTGPLEKVIETKKKAGKDILAEQKEERKKRISSIKSSRAFRIGVDIGGKMITGLLKSKVPLLNAVDARDYLPDVEGLQDYVFVIDDIERCSFSIPGLLGFINEMVEHVHAKVILVINEDAFLKRQKENRPVKEYSDYLGIKEKLVGTVIRYKSDNPSVFEKLIRSNLEEGSFFRESALKHIGDFCAMVKEIHHRSLRTFQFFLSRLKNIEDKMTESEKICGIMDSEAGENTADKLVLELFEMCLDYRENFALATPQPAEKEYKFPSLAYYVERGILDINRLEQEIVREVVD